jgi:hypothetical protein
VLEVYDVGAVVSVTELAASFEVVGGVSVKEGML